MEKISADIAISLASDQQNAKKECLTVVDIHKAEPNTVNFARGIIKEKQCFSNALQLAVANDWNVVMGYLIIDDLPVSIEHAWNVDQDGHHVDLTSEVFLHNLSATHVQLVKLNNVDALALDRESNGLEHLSLRRSELYADLFKSPLR